MSVRHTNWSNKMGISDYDYVNFEQDYELNYHLEKVNKRQTQFNRNTLKLMGGELKLKLNKTLLKHYEFHAYVMTQLSRLE